ncbi:HlyD family secretion protein [Pseudomonas sp. Teo4]|uniref:HlyD family secretion protein n=1 Tax=Pseudomonas sp. Teo4 TaxID=3064528 RepID=UPI002ACB0FDD|nr:HlyD family secretion protein [Pseudomonas sp. Teo4]
MRLAPKKRKVRLVASVLAIAAVGWTLHWWSVARFMVDTDDAYLEADNVGVSPRVSGTVAEVLIEDNQTIKAGQPLVRLDDRRYRAAFDQQAALIAARRAEIANGEAQLAERRATVLQAQARLHGEQANVTYSDGQVRRYQPLVDSGAEPRERLEELRNAAKQAQSAQAAQSAAVEVAQRQLVTLQASINQARAQLASAQAAAAKAQLDIDDSVVYSEVAGRVGDRGVRVGQYVQPGTRLMTVVPVEQAYITANFKETQLDRLRPGQSVRIHVDAYPQAMVTGRLESFAPGTGAQFALLPPDNATGNFTKIVQRVPVRIRLQDSSLPPGTLVPGLSVHVEVDTRG